MRYLIYSCNYVTPHLETEMEIAYKAINEGDEVYFLVCNADLKTCFINPQHKMSICNACQSKVKGGLKMLGIPRERILSLSQFKIDSINPDYSFASVQQLKEFTYKGSDIGIAVASSLVSSTRDHQFDTIKHSTEIRQGLFTAIMVHEVGTQVLDLVKPDVVIMFNGRFLEYRPLMRLCENKKIDFYTHERGGNTDRYMLRKNSTPHSIAFAKDEINRLWLNAGAEKYTIGENFFRDRRNKVVQSWSVFTEEQKAGLLPKEFDSKKKNIGFFNSSMDEYEGIPDFNNPVYDDDHAGIANVCASFLNDKNYHFYLRVHPNLKGLNNAQNDAINKLGAKFDNLTIIPADADTDTYALMEAVDLVITFGSTIGVETAFWNKPAILLGRAFYEDLEGIIQPKSHEEAILYISNIPPVHAAAKSSAVKFGYWCISFGIGFEHFKPNGLFSGTFNGKKVDVSIASKIKNKVNLFLGGS